MPIQLKIPSVQIKQNVNNECLGRTTPEESGLILSALKNIQPQIFIFPENKTFEDVAAFKFSLEDDNFGRVWISFKD